MTTSFQFSIKSTIVNHTSQINYAPQTPCSYIFSYFSIVKECFADISINLDIRRRCSSSCWNIYIFMLLLFFMFRHRRGMFHWYFASSGHQSVRFIELMKHFNFHIFTVFHVLTSSRTVSLIFRLIWTSVGHVQRIDETFKCSCFYYFSCL